MSTPASDATTAARAGTMARSCICFSTRQAARALTQLYDEALRPAGIRSTQLALLNAVRLLGPLSVKRLAAAVVIDRTTLTRSLKPLEREGYVNIEAGADLRERRVALTRRGSAKLEEAFTLWEAAQAQVRNRLGPENLELLQKMLRALVSSTRRS